jgi:hypothetical protein
MVAIQSEALAKGFDLTKNQMKELQEQNNLFRLEITKSLDDCISDFNGKINGIKLVESMHEDAARKMAGHIELLKQSQEQHSNLIESCNVWLEQVDKEVSVVKATKLNESEFDKLKDKVLGTVKVSLAKIEDVNSKIEATDNYLARYLPFNQFC